MLLTSPGDAALEQVTLCGALEHCPFSSYSLCLWRAQGRCPPPCESSCALLTAVHHHFVRLAVTTSLPHDNGGFSELLDADVRTSRSDGLIERSLTTSAPAQPQCVKTSHVRGRCNDSNVTFGCAFWALLILIAHVLSCHLVFRAERDWEMNEDMQTQWGGDGVTPQQVRGSFAQGKRHMAPIAHTSLPISRYTPAA